MNVAYSVLSAGTVGVEVSDAYGLGQPVECALVSAGTNDTYRVLAGGETYIARVYRSGWRTDEEIQFELDWLLHLQRSGLAVSVPLRRRDGALTGVLAAPEGPRALVLFSHAPGTVLSYTEEETYRLGSALARLHTASDSFTTTVPRFRLDMTHLLEEPLSQIRPFAEERGDWSYLEGLAERLRSAVAEAEPFLDAGICHGDPHGHNVHQTETGELTFFDFDCGGPGWRSYDLAVVRWALHLHAKQGDPWNSFLDGYRSVRPVGERDLALVPTFVALRTIWLMGVHASQVTQRGTAWVMGSAGWGAGMLRNWPA